MNRNLDAARARRQAIADQKLEEQRARTEARLRNTRRVAKREVNTAQIAKTATNWLFFWLVLGITVFKDVIDLLLTALEAATTATVVGIPIAILCGIIGFIMTLTVSIITMTYHLYTKKALGTKFLITSIGLLLGSIPVLNLLPESVITFVASHFVGEIANAARKTVGKISNFAGKSVT